MLLNVLSTICIYIVFLQTFTSCRKHPVHGRYTRNIEDYELSVPHKLTLTGEFISFEIPHFFEHNFGKNRRKRSPKDPDTLHLGVHANNELHHVVLWPNNALISPDLVIETRNSEGLQQTKFHDLQDRKLCYYTGQIDGMKESRAALSTCDGLVGYINIGDERFFIEPLEDHNANDEGHHLHVVYKKDTMEEAYDDEDDYSDERKCRSADDDMLKNTIESTVNDIRTKRSKNSTFGGAPRYIETMIVCDKRFLEYHRDLNRERFILTVLNMAAEYFHDASIGQEIDIVLVRLLYLEKQEKELDLAITQDAEKTLQSFCKWQTKFNPPDGSPAHADVTLLFTKFDICHGGDCEIVGQSYIGTPCVKEKSCAYCEDNGLELGLVIAHEMGHIMGAYHDDISTSGCAPDDPNDNTPYIMSAETNLTAIRWSTCSRDYIQGVISQGLADCLLDRPPPTPLIPKPVLPGVVYDWTAQCQRMVPGAQACPTGESRLLLCKELRCLKPYKEKKGEKLECFSVGKPAVDGTKCGDNLWCFHGNCIKQGKRPETVNGGWSEWGEWSICTRTCGNGITYSLRECNNPLPQNGGRYCDGDKIWYKLCNPEVCPESAPSFRQQQCNAFNSIPDPAGKTHKYKAFLNPEAPCALWCTTGEDENVELDMVAKDGTRCRPGTKNVCVNGQCMKVGCDNQLDSKAVEDACGVCNGDGTGCKIVQDTYKEIGQKDYSTVVVLPAGVKKVEIQELAPSQNVIAITDKSEKKFYLNGKYTEQPDGVYKFGKVEGVYMHTAPNQEQLVIKGPLKEDLVFKVLFLKRENVGYKYKYSEISLDSTMDEPTFHWEIGDFTECSARCGGGIQTARLDCFEDKAGKVSDSFCISLEKPVQSNQHCNIKECTTKWKAGKWGDCDACKGKPGVRLRGVECVQVNPVPTLEEILVEDDRCSDPQPGKKQVCSSDKPCKGKRYVHYIPDKHVGDVWIKMQPKSLKKRAPTSNNSQPITTSTAQTCIPRPTIKSFESGVVKDNNSSLSSNLTAIEEAGSKKDSVKPPKVGYALDRQPENESKLVIFELKKDSIENVTISAENENPLSDLVEDANKTKIIEGVDAAKLLKELGKKSQIEQEKEKKKVSIKPIPIEQMTFKNPAKFDFKKGNPTQDPRLHEGLTIENVTEKTTSKNP